MDLTADELTNLGILSRTFAEGAPPIEGLHLDYSPDSLRAIDRLLVTSPNIRWKDRMRSTVAAYVGDVLIRAANGRWGHEDDHPYAIIVDTSPVRAYPFAEVWRRIDHPADGSILEWSRDTLRSWDRRDPPDLPPPGLTVQDVQVLVWNLQIRDHWRPHSGPVPEIQSPSRQGLIQMSRVDFHAAVPDDAILTACRGALTSGGTRDPDVGEIVVRPTAERVAGGRGIARSGHDMSVFVAANELSLLVMTFLHDGLSEQEQADAEATMASARSVASEPRKASILSRFRH